MTPFFELAELYLWPVAAALTCGICLSLMGMHITARKESLQALVSNQITVSLYLAVMLVVEFASPENGDEFLRSGFVVNIAALGGALCLQGLRRWQRGARSDEVVSLQLVLFLGLLSLSHLLGAANPSFEGQLLRSLMGDIVLVSDAYAQALVIASLLLIVLGVFWRRDVLLRSFSLSVLGRSAHTVGLQTRPGLGVIEFAFIFFLCICTVKLGFLFTSMLLLMPTQALSMTRIASIQRHALGVTCVAGFSVLVGFGVSLQATQIPTVPFMGLILLVISVFCWLSGGSHERLPYATESRVKGERKTK